MNRPAGCRCQVEMTDESWYVESVAWLSLGPSKRSALMGRVLIATVVGAVVLFAWGMAAWMVLPLHDGSIKRISDETVVATLLQKQGLKTGVYMYPAMPEPGAGMPQQEIEKAEAEWKERHTNGPIFSIYYTTEGSEPMPPKMMAGGWVINFIAVCIASVLLRLASGGGLSYLRRVG